MASSSTTPAVDHHPAAPPPTPCNHSHSLPASCTDAALSHLIQQLSHSTLSSPPLSRLRRRRIPPPAPTISLLEHQDTSLLLSAFGDHGFFHLSDHGIPRELATSAFRQGASLLQQEEERQGTTTRTAVLGFEEGSRMSCGCLVFDTADAHPLPSALASFAGEMARVGVACAEMLLAAAGLRNPFSDNNCPRCLMWVSPRSSSTQGLGEEGPGLGMCRLYPHVVCARYQITEGSEDEWLLEDDSGGTFNTPTRPDTILVTIGDIAHVWSNGRFRKVAMPPCPPNPTDGGGADTAALTVMVTLPTDSLIFAHPPRDQERDDCNDKSVEEAAGFQHMYSPFCLEEYAWRLHQEDPPSVKDKLLESRN